VTPAQDATQLLRYCTAGVCPVNVWHLWTSDAGRANIDCLTQQITHYSTPPSHRHSIPAADGTGRLHLGWSKTEPAAVMGNR
jgi:hypothetical protein